MLEGKETMAITTITGCNWHGARYFIVGSADIHKMTHLNRAVQNK